MQSKHSPVRYGIFALIVAGAALLSLLSRPPTRKTRVEWPVMGTVGAITFRGGDAVRQGTVRETVQREWHALEARLSAWRTDSELAQLSPLLAAKGAAALFEVPGAVRACYAFAFDLKRQSGGAFDPVVGEKMRQAGFSRQTTLDLGAVAKGFAVDRAYEALEKDGDFLLDLGGNLRAHGGAWHTGVRNPFDPSRPAAVFDLPDGMAVATSGSYERFVERDGRRFSHILDARTGESVAGTAGVTVIASTAMMADGLSTTLFVLGPEAGLAFLKRHYPGTAALWIPDTPDKPEIKATVTMAVQLSECRYPVTVLH